MSSANLTPSSTTSNTGAITGAANAHSALSDSSDSTYIDYDYGESTYVPLSDLSLPSGAVIKSATVMVRCARPGAGTILGAGLSDVPSMNDVIVFWTSATTIAFGTVPTAYLTDAILDAATLFVICRNVSNDLRVYEAYVAVVYVTQPSVTVDAPTSTLSDTNKATSEWTNTLDSDGGAQTHYEAKLFTDAVVSGGGFDADTSTAVEESGVVASSSESHAFTSALSDGDYHTYVRVGQTVNGSTHWSDWDGEAFTVSVNIPNDPSIDVTAQASAGQMRIDLTDNAGDATTDLYEIQRSDDGGSTWSAIRTIEGTGRVTADANDDATVYDREAPNGTTVTYRARAIHDYGDDLEGASDWVTDTASYASGWWLKHPTDPTLDYQIAYGEITSLPGHSRTSRRGVFQPLGASTPTVIRDTYEAKAGELVLRCDSDADRASLAALLDAGTPILMLGREGDHWTDRWVSFGDQDTTLVIDKSWTDATYETLPWVEVVAPTDNLEAWPEDGS